LVKYVAPDTAAELALFNVTNPPIAQGVLASFTGIATNLPITVDIGQARLIGARIVGLVIPPIPTPTWAWNESGFERFSAQAILINVALS
jgi:hypothetical protein